MSLFLAVAIYVILWWLVFFALLPIGAKSAHEAGEQYVPGAEHGAPKVHRLGLKMLLAAGIAAVLWLAVAWAVAVDLFRLYPQ
jgi:predicted secreted protein